MMNEAVFHYILVPGDIFITRDNHFLNKREELKSIVDVKIMNPKEFVEYVETKLKTERETEKEV